MEDANRFSLAALGKVGTFTVEVLRGSDGSWMLSVESPTWFLDFKLAGPDSIHELAEFFRTQVGRTAFSELAIGSFGSAIVRVIKDDEFADRFYLRVADGGAMAEFPLVGGAAQEFAAAAAEAATDLMGGAHESRTR
jgi:hypothetical protein